MRDTGQWSFQRVSDTCPPYLVDVDSSDDSAGVACAVSSGVAVPKAGRSFEPDSGTTPNMSAGHLRAVASPLLSALGLDAASAVVTVPAATVSVNPHVAGLPTIGYDTDIVVDSNGIRAATGWGYPDEPVKGDLYPLVSTQDALKLFDSLPRPMMGVPEIACPQVSTKSPSAMPAQLRGAVAAGDRDRRRASAWSFGGTAPRRASDLAAGGFLTCAAATVRWYLSP